MALTGTLKDFGVADIFQFISQQAKSGVLHLKGLKGEEVHISFHHGAVVGAEHVSRSRRELLGRMLVRAELISEAQLADALEAQKRTLRRLGDILVEEQALSREELREMTQLQVTETLYALFQWKSGTYEFEAKEVSWDSESMIALRSEAVLMDGFRIVDEWPLVRKKIPSLQNTFQIIGTLPPPRSKSTSESSFADLMGDGEDDGSIAQRRVMDLITPTRTVEDLIDLSRLGSFETCKTLATLLDQGLLVQISPSRAETMAREAEKGVFTRLGPHAIAVAYSMITLAVFVWVGIGLLGWMASTDRWGRGEAHQAFQRSVSSAQIERIRFALEVFRLETGSYPSSLQELLGGGLLGVTDLHHPWENTYDYRRDGTSGYVLLPPEG